VQVLAVCGDAGFKFAGVVAQVRMLVVVCAAACPVLTEAACVLGVVQL
jgi:hypothetical protein